MTPETGLENLATRLEQAEHESQAELLREAFEALHPWGEPVHSPYFGESRTRPLAALRKKVSFTAMLDIGAYLSAAEILVRSEHGFRVEHFGEGKACACVWPRARRPALCPEATTAALALAAACVRAALSENSQ